jgi:hypothetical protein
MFGLPVPRGPSPASVAARPQNGGRKWLHLPRSTARRILFLGIYLLFCANLVFFGAKLFWKFQAGVPIDEAAFVRDFYFPEIRRSRVKEIEPRHDDPYFDVLLLGGSVLEPGWGTVEELLTGKFRAELGNRFQVYNFGHSAHTSRDSVQKYREMAGEQFDLVIVYDGINDVRLNCCPREFFRDDYSHFAWYRSMQKHLLAGSMSSQTSLVEQAGLAAQTFSFNPSDEALLEEGREVKTALPVRRNLEEIVWTALGRGDALLLLTEAYYIPVDYTQERFRKQTLDYSFRADGRSCNVESWGKPQYVAAAVDAQNEAIRNLAAEHPEAFFVDEQELMPAEGRMFVDPCHFTEEGSRRFVENLWPAVAKRIRVWEAARVRSLNQAATLR